VRHEDVGAVEVDKQELTFAGYGTDLTAEQAPGESCGIGVTAHRTAAAHLDTVDLVPSELRLQVGAKGLDLG
jgi:hypothetical protein